MEENRSKPDQYQLRFPAGMRDELKALAEINGRSLNAEIIARLADSLKLSSPYPELSGYGFAALVMRLEATADAMQDVFLAERNIRKLKFGNIATKYPHVNYDIPKDRRSKILSLLADGNIDEALALVPEEVERGPREDLDPSEGAGQDGSDRTPS